MIMVDNRWQRKLNSSLDMSRYSTKNNPLVTTKSLMKHVAGVEFKSIQDSNEKPSTAMQGEMVSTAISYSINN